MEKVLMGRVLEAMGLWLCRVCACVVLLLPVVFLCVLLWNAVQFFLPGLEGTAGVAASPVTVTGVAAVDGMGAVGAVGNNSWRSFVEILLHAGASVRIAVCAVVVALPFALCLLVYLEHYVRGRVAKICSFVMDILAAVPPVLYGLVVSVLFPRAALGVVVLGLSIVPHMVRALGVHSDSDDVFRTALALGATGSEALLGAARDINVYHLVSVLLSALMRVTGEAVVLSMLPGGRLRGGLAPEILGNIADSVQAGAGGGAGSLDVAALVLLVMILVPDFLGNWAWRKGWRLAGR